MEDLPAPASIDNLTTESINPRSERLDALSPLEVVRLMNAEDASVAAAVATQEASIAAAITVISERLRGGGRLIYIGAGTSGRLGVLDASECPPTFNTPPEMVIGLIAGGDSALRKAAEGVEDRPERAREDLEQIRLCDKDVLVGIATSGRTPYVIGGLEYARQCGAYPIGLSCNEGSPMADVAELMITPVVGPEIVSGSTRMKSGTATKMVLNMLTTGTMVQLGKTYGNLMVDLRATNSKLLARTQNLVMRLTGLDKSAATKALKQCDGELKTTVVSVIKEVPPETARQILYQSAGKLRAALEYGGPEHASPEDSSPEKRFRHERG